MENKKSSKGLVITLVIFMLAFAACAALLFTGVIKSPLIEEKKCTETKCDTKTTDDTKKTDTKTDATTEKTADERYKEYINNLTKLVDNMGDSEEIIYDYYYGANQKKCHFHLDKNKILYVTVDDKTLKVSDDVIYYSNVIINSKEAAIGYLIYFLKTDGNLYYTTIDGVFYESTEPFDIKDAGFKNIVGVKNISDAKSSLPTNEPIFIDIDGNVIFKNN